MVDVQDGDAHTQKRTAIPQLLNPVSSSPTKRQEEHGFSTSRGTFQHSSLTAAVRSNLTRPDLSPAGPATFNLRAADWGRGDSSPPSTVHYASSPDTNGSVRGRSASYSTYDSGPRSNDGGGYLMTSSFSPVLYHSTSVSSSPNPAPHTLRPTPVLFCHDGLAGNHQTQSPPESPRPGTGPPTPSDASGKEPWPNARSPVRTIIGEPRQANSVPGMVAYRPPPYQAPFITVPIFMQMPPAPPKRPNNEEEESSGAPRKKPRTSRAKADGSVAPKRGYTAKKRSEAAQIAAQNEMMASVAYQPQQTEGGQSVEKTAATPASNNNARLPPVLVEKGGKLHPELQFARCMSHRYRNERFPRCVSCTRRWAGDTCRFQSIRFFLRDENKVIVGISFVENQKADSPTMDFPKKWNVPLEPSHVGRVKRTVARALFPVLKTELEHLHVPEIIRRPRESEVRATCDTCMTSIFSSSWMCRLCGREACAECFEQVKVLTDNNGAEDADVFELQARREKHSRRNPFFLACTRRNEHQAKDFSPMTRFCKSELEVVIKEMEELLATPDPDPPLTGDAEVPDLDVEMTPGDQVGSLPNHRLLEFKRQDLSYDMFTRLWAMGKPLVVTGLLPQFKISWTPEHFIENYASKSCLVIQCQSDMNKRITVGDFFKEFGKYEGRKDCWKLKDWPPSTDFKTAFPELYADFSQAIPMPNYVRRDGVLNIASHFPSNTVAPDIGPKMYNAMASSDTPGTKGSTRLHMDMADAVNVMLYSAPTPDGKPGCAVWDIYDASDAGKIRDFLKNKFKGKFQNDPIHSQMFYLDFDLRKELYEEFGVKSYRIYQKPGDVVFIPAGCAHQVCNLADCMKIAIDFVSPENIDRCEGLTREFREQNQSMQWKEDVLQLRTMMWFSWLSCRLHEAVQGNEKANASGAVAIASVSNNKSIKQAKQPRSPPDPGPMDIDRSLPILPPD